ncbi:MAG: RNA polymerase sigma factor [Bacteroides sp.]|nr:RNA polymerase sigma factor [Bacteroides sp.]
MEEIVKGCRAGKENARKRLYTLYAKQLLAVSYRYTGNMDDAHDVLHDGFIKIFTHFNYRGECLLKTWLVRVITTQAIDFLRQKQRLESMHVSDEYMSNLPDERDALEQSNHISEEVLMQMVAELPDGCRTVFNLYVFEEKTHKEIAQLLHIKEHTSTSQYHRAKALLIKKIKEYEKRG